MPVVRQKKHLNIRRVRTPSAKSILNELQIKTPGPKFTVRTGRRQGIVTGNVDPFPEPPADFTGTRPEWAIMWAHGVLKKKLGEDYQYISYVAGIQVDFEEFDLGIVLNIQGLFWHYFFSGRKQFEDLETRALIEATGVILINIDENHALADPVYYLREALNGIDHSLQAKGLA